MKESLVSNLMWHTLAQSHETDAVNHLTVDFKLVYQLQFTALFGGLRGSYYHSLEGSGTILYLPSTSNWSAWKYSSPMLDYHYIPATLPTFICGVMFVMRDWIPGSPSYSCICRSGSLAVDKAGADQLLLKFSKLHLQSQTYREVIPLPIQACL